MPFSPYVLSADNLSMNAGKTSFARWSRNCAIVPNLFLQQGQPGTVTPLLPWAALTFMPRWSVVGAGEEASLRRITGMMLPS